MRSLPRLAWSCAASAILLSACSDSTDVSPAPVVEPEPVFPHLMARPEHRDLILSRLGREPYAAIFSQVEALAARDYVENQTPGRWDPGATGRNGSTAQASAFVAWLNDDAQAAAKARAFFDRLETDWATNNIWDANIRMPEPLMGYTNAWDLLKATPYFSDEEDQRAADKLTTITGQFFEHYLENPALRTIILGTTQNNHPIRTASAIGYVALAFPEHPDARKWANWAFSELDYLWSSKGQYVQADGGVSEGPFYFGFGWGVSAAMFIAMDNALLEPPTFERDCRNRMDVEPWAGHGCVEGEPFVFDNPIRGELFPSAVAWSVSLRLPWGNRPPLGDAYFNPFNGGALLTSFGGDGTFRWDWENNRDDAYELDHGAQLSMHHLIYFDDAVSAREPQWTTRFMPDAGNAVFRSDWSEDARWLLLVAEAGAVRKTVHDHVDGTSISLAAYGEYLLLDSGYYKPDEMDNAITSHAQSHNVVLINGETAPDKGLLTDFGDADALLTNTHDGTRVDYAEAHQEYQDSRIERSVVFIDGRYFIVSDRISTTRTEPREHAWRMHGYAGFGSGGTFEVSLDGARWERALAGIDVRVASTMPGLLVREPDYVVNQAPHVHQFERNREVADHGVIDAVVEATSPGFLAVLAPYRAAAEAGSADAPLQLEALELGEGTAGWRITSSSGVDIAIQRSADSAETIVLPGGAELQTDAKLAFVRVDGGAPLAVMVRGTFLRLHGNEVLSTSEAFAVRE